MISTMQVIGTMVAVIMVLLIFKIQQKKEYANRLARRLCEQNNLQFLDGTVVFRGLHLVRPNLELAFRFKFDYSVNSTDRYPGYISLVGKIMQNLYIAPEHLTPHEARLN